MKVIKNTLLFGIKFVAAVAAAIHVLRDKDVSKQQLSLFYAKQYNKLHRKADKYESGPISRCLDTARVSTDFAGQPRHYAAASARK